MNGAGKSGNQCGMVDAAFDMTARIVARADERLAEGGYAGVGPEWSAMLKKMRESVDSARDKQERNPLEAALPAHKASLHLIHNQHKGYHETAQQYLEGLMDWEIDPETRRQCIEADSIWELQWYPETSVGFYKVYGPTLESVLAAAKEVK